MSKIIVALDGLIEPAATALARKLQGEVWGFKFNSMLLEYGSIELATFKKFGHLMGDPKLDDVPNTMINSVDVLRLFDFVTVHVSSGPTALKKVMETVPTWKLSAAKILAVTVLTSMTEEEVQLIFRRSRTEAIKDFSKIAWDCGVHGIVCAGPDLPLVREYDFLKVVPAIRPHGLLPGDDQVHLANIEAMKEADYLVVGTPITTAKDPLAVVREINNMVA